MNDELLQASLLANQPQNNMLGELLNDTGEILYGVSMLSNLAGRCGTKLDILCQHPSLVRGVQQDTEGIHTGLSLTQSTLRRTREDISKLHFQIQMLEMTVAGLKGEEYGDEMQPQETNIASSSEVELLITAPVLPKKTKFFPQTRSSSGSPGGRQQRSHQTKVPTDRAKSESPKVRNALAPKIHHRASSDRLRAPHSQKPRAPSPLSQQLSTLKLSPYSGKRIHVEGGSMTSAWAPKAADEHLPSSAGHMDTDIDMDHDGYGKESSTGSSETPPRHLAKNNRLFKSAVRDCTRPVE